MNLLTKIFKDVEVNGISQVRFTFQIAKIFKLVEHPTKARYLFCPLPSLNKYYTSSIRALKGVCRARPKIVYDLGPKSQPLSTHRFGDAILKYNNQAQAL
jgi:hypothetical protein